MALSLPSPSSLLEFSKIVEGDVVKTLENHLRLQAKVHIIITVFHIFFSVIGSKICLIIKK